MRVLECSTRGDRRFSALYARVKVFGNERTIEEHYQLSKRFPWAPATWREAKGKRPVHIEVGGVRLPAEYLTSWYAYLWLRYLDSHPELVEYARQFDEFRDSMAKPGTNSQAEMVRLYVKEGREALLRLAMPFIRAWQLAKQQQGGDSMMNPLVQLSGVDPAMLEKSIITLARRIKNPAPWPEKPATYDWQGFRVWVGYTPKGRFRRVAITPPGGGQWTVNLVDANPEKVKDAAKKVMVYLTVNSPEHSVVHYVGQVRLGDGSAQLAWLGTKDKTAPQPEKPVAEQSSSSLADEIEKLRAENTFLKEKVDELQLHLMYEEQYVRDELLGHIYDRMRHQYQYFQEVLRRPEDARVAAFCKQLLKQVFATLEDVGVNFREREVK